MQLIGVPSQYTLHSLPRLYHSLLRTILYILLPIEEFQKLFQLCTGMAVYKKFILCRKLKLAETLLRISWQTDR